MTNEKTIPSCVRPLCDRTSTLRARGRPQLRIHIFVGLAASLLSACMTDPIPTHAIAPPSAYGGGTQATEPPSGAGGGEGGAPSQGSTDAGAPGGGPQIAVPSIGSATTNAPTVCGSGAAPIAYLWAKNGTLFTFDPSSLSMHALGVVSCPTSATPSTLTVSQDGTAYMMYDDNHLFHVDLTTLACSPTPYANGQLGFSGQQAIALGTAPGRLYVYGRGASPTIGVSDLASFLLFQVGAVSPAPEISPVELKVDAYGRMFALAKDGTLTQIDPSTGAALGADHTGFDGATGGCALMAYDGGLYFFGGYSGGVSRYDLETKALSPLGQVNEIIVGASAAPCIAAKGAPDAGAPAGPFSPGDAWIGNYVCPQGLTNVAIVVTSVDEDGVKARFDFDSVTANVVGSFELTGTFDPATRHATFGPGAWVTQPASSWTTVGLDGFVDESGHQLAGNITSPGCGAFSVQR